MKEISELREIDATPSIVIYLKERVVVPFLGRAIGDHVVVNQVVLEAYISVHVLINAVEDSVADLVAS